MSRGNWNPDVIKPKAKCRLCARVVKAREFVRLNGINPAHRACALAKGRPFTEGDAIIGQDVNTEMTPIAKAVHCTGAEFKPFAMDAAIWPDGRFLDHYEISVNGLDWSFECEPTDDANVLIEPFGSVCDDDLSFAPILLTTYFEQWRASARSR